MYLPRNLIKADWFRTIADINPVSYLLEGIRSVLITGWDGTALWRAFNDLRRGRGDRPDRLVACAPSRGSAAHDGRTVPVRSARGRVAQPPQLLHEPRPFSVPRSLFPLFFFTAFAGGLSTLGKAPGFHYHGGYTAFQFAFVMIQASAFGGVFTGFGMAADFEYGFAQQADAGDPEPARDHRPATR